MKIIYTIDSTSSGENSDIFSSFDAFRAARRRQRRVEVKAARIAEKRKLVVIPSVDIDVVIAGQHVLRALVDSESEINFISRRLIQRLKLASSVNLEPIRVKSISESKMRTYEVHFLNLKVKDDSGTARYFNEFFLEADISDEKLVLSLSFMTMANPDVNYQQRRFT